MKITQSTLRKIIREELEAVVNEAVPKSTYRGKVRNKDGRTGMVSSTRKDKLGLMMTVVYRDGETPAQETLYASDLEALNESKFDKRFNAVRNAVADILNALGKRRKDLSIAQREGLPKLAARVVDGELGAEDAAKELSKN
jgi:hypothetical protein